MFDIFQLISFSTIYQRSSSELRYTSTTTWHTVTSWMRCFPLSLSRELLRSDTNKPSITWDSFPEILVIQVSRLVSKIKEESQGDTESATRKELQEKISALPQPRLARATDALTMIWNGIMGPLDVPTLEPKLPTLFGLLPFLNWSRVKLAFLRSISTGVFIDVQFFAYNAISDGRPVDLRPLYTSTIAIQGWAAEITTRRSESPTNTPDSDLWPKKLRRQILNPRASRTDWPMTTNIGMGNSRKHSVRIRRPCA